MSGIIKAYPTTASGVAAHQEITGTTRGVKHYLDVNRSLAPGTKVVHNVVLLEDSGGSAIQMVDGSGVPVIF